MRYPVGAHPLAEAPHARETDALVTRAVKVAGAAGGTAHPPTVMMISFDGGLVPSTFEANTRM